MFENLTEKLERSFKIIKGQGRITEINVAETLKEVRRALLDADVSYRVAKDFCNDVKAKAMGQNVLTAVRPDQMMIKIVHDELVTLMGSTATDINIKGKPGIVLVAGLQGSGKTTFCGKLALNCKSKRGLKVMLVAGDVYRPAAIDQLKVLGGQIEVFVYSEDGVKDPVRIAIRCKGKLFACYRRHSRPSGCGRGDDGRDSRHQRGHKAYRDPLCCGCHDRSGCRGDSQGIQRQA